MTLWCQVLYTMNFTYIVHRFSQYTFAGVWMGDAGRCCEIMRGWVLPSPLPSSETAWSPSWQGSLGNTPQTSCRWRSCRAASWRWRFMAVSLYDPCFGWLYLYVCWFRNYMTLYDIVWNSFIHNGNYQLLSKFTTDGDFPMECWHTSATAVFQQSCDVADDIWWQRLSLWRLYRAVCDRQYVSGTDLVGDIRQPAE